MIGSMAQRVDSSAISGVNVALNKSVWRQSLRGVRATICLTWGIKPMSNMRSASSKTNCSINPR